MRFLQEVIEVHAELARGVPERRNIHDPVAVNVAAKMHHRLDESPGVLRIVRSEPRRDGREPLNGDRAVVMREGLPRRGVHTE